MATEKNSSRKNSTRKKFPVLITIAIFIIIIFLVALYFFFPFKKSESGLNKKVIENPLKNIILENTNAKGEVNIDKVVQEATAEFNEVYINYILIALGVKNLHASSFGYGNPKIELRIDDEIWSSEIVDGRLHTKKQATDDEDAIIYMSKKEAVHALLSSNLTDFMTDSVKSGRTRIEMIADNTELFTKGYLKMYQELAG
ncbi:MAG: hypothetical protein RL557_12 [archaeon]|jgi:flagellar basal body-associated protein FliL